MKEKFITRTITVTSAVYICATVSTLIVEQKTGDLIGDFTATEVLTELKETVETEDLKIVAVTSMSKHEYKCKLPEKEFFIQADKELINE